MSDLHDCYGHLFVQDGIDDAKHTLPDAINLCRTGQLLRTGRAGILRQKLYASYDLSSNFLSWEIFNFFRCGRFDEKPIVSHAFSGL